MGCIIIGLLNVVFSLIFFAYSIMDIYYHNISKNEPRRSVRAAFHEGKRDGDGPIDRKLKF